MLSSLETQSLRSKSKACKIYLYLANSERCSIIAITGLDGHAYGSWRGKGNLRPMWLRDFLSKDLPNCRTMIYGHNTKLSSRGVDTIMDYGREVLEGIKKVRRSKEVRALPFEAPWSGTNG